MASSSTNKTAADAATRLYTSKTWKMLLLTGTTTDWDTAATARDMNFADEITDDEASHASYARVTITPSTSEDDTNDRGEIHFADVTFSSLAAAVGQILGVAVIEVVTNDADSPIRALYDVASLNVTPDGNDFIVRDGAEGAIHITVG
jgi:hypothetical protein